MIREGVYEVSGLWALDAILFIMVATCAVVFYSLGKAVLKIGDDK